MTLVERSEQLLDELKMFKSIPLSARCFRTISDLLDLVNLYEQEIDRLTQQVKVLQMSDEEKIEDIKEGIRATYRAKNSI